MTMQKYDIEKLRDLPIEGVAERLGLQVSRHKCLCPFHDDAHPSLSFRVNRNTFRCFVCGASGGTIDLVMKCLGKGFREACRWLQTLPSAPPCREGNGYSCNGIYSSPYREGRGGSCSTSGDWMLAWCAGAGSPHGKTGKGCRGCRYLIIIRRGSSWACRTAT